jgi:hypothetical protein
VSVDVYFHDYTEVDPRSSWTGLCAPLKGATYTDITQCTVPAVLSLFDYARPDVVVTVNNVPVMSLEQTRGNPSGHNIPQRFSFGVRAAELGVPSILYYPLYSRRTASDPNPRWVNPRVLLAQFRMSDTYQVPALSIFWPTDPNTILPATGQAAQQQMADVTADLVRNQGRRRRLLGLPSVVQALGDMRAAAIQLSARQQDNPSVRALLPNGFGPEPRTGLTVDPPPKAKLWKSLDYVRSLERQATSTGADWPTNRVDFVLRDFTLVWQATANAARTDSEHPWYGYLNLIDMLYTRTTGRLHTFERDHNLVYELAVDVNTFQQRLNRAQPPTSAYIVDIFSDLLVLQNGVIPGRPIRGSGPATIDLAW